MATDNKSTVPTVNIVSRGGKTAKLIQPLLSAIAKGPQRVDALAKSMGCSDREVRQTIDLVRNKKIASIARVAPSTFGLGEFVAAKPASVPAKS